MVKYSEETELLNCNLYDYNGVYILVRGEITNTGHIDATQVA